VFYYFRDKQTIEAKYYSYSESSCTANLETIDFAILNNVYAFLGEGVGEWFQWLFSENLAKSDLILGLFLIF